MSTRKYLLLPIFLLTISAAAQVIVNVSPNSPSVPSAGQQQFRVSVIGTTNTGVQWYTCPGGTITQSGLFTAPAVTKNTSICVYAISDEDPSKSSTAYAQVKAPTTPPQPVQQCTTESIWSKLQPSEYYNLPAWMMSAKEVPLTWVQPADVTYQNTEFQSTHYNITAFQPTGNGGDVTFEAVNVLGIGDYVKLSGFQVAKNLNNLTVEVLESTPTHFMGYVPVDASGESDRGVATITAPAAMQFNQAEMLGGVNTGAGDKNLYCQWLLVQGGKPPYVYSGTGTPPGLIVKPNGLYTGVSTRPGLYKNVVFCAKDAAGTQVCTKPRWQNVCDGGKTPCLISENDVP